MRFLMLAMVSWICLAAGRVVAEETSKGGAVTVTSVKQPEKTGFNFSSWLKDIKKRIAKTRARPNQLVAVAAVRGDEKDIAPKLYWKGKKSEGSVASNELDDFDKAIDAALANDPAAPTRLQAFLSSYPKSAMAPDARTALDHLTPAAAGR